MEKQKRKQTTLTLAEKVRIVEDFESNGVSHAALGRKYGVGTSTVTHFIQQKDELRQKLALYLERGVTNRKTMKAQSFPLLEEVLFVWILQKRAANMIVPPDVLRSKAELFFGQLQRRGIYGDQRFAFSNGWISRFRSRFGLPANRVESADVEVAKFRKVFHEKLAALKLKMCQVYGAVESALFVKTLASRSGNLSDQKTARYTFMPCANMDGSHKLRLMFIGAEDKPESSNLPVSYCCSKQAWLTRQLFKRWFHEGFVPAVRKFSAKNGIEPRALLLLDNCTAHYDGVDGLISDDGLIGVMFLPPNVTSECQPMNRVVIDAVKTRYKRKLMLKLVWENVHLEIEDRLKKITLPECIGWIAEAWAEIAPKTIRNSWKKLVDHYPEDGFCQTDEADGVENGSDTDGLEDEVRQLAAAVDILAGTCTTERELELWLQDRVYDAHSNLTSEILSDEEILDSVLHRDVELVPIVNDS